MSVKPTQSNWGECMAATAPGPACYTCQTHNTCDVLSSSNTCQTNSTPDVPSRSNTCQTHACQTHTTRDVLSCSNACQTQNTRYLLSCSKTTRHTFQKCSVLLILLLLQMFVDGLLASHTELDRISSNATSADNNAALQAFAATRGFLRNSMCVNPVSEILQSVWESSRQDNTTFFKKTMAVVQNDLISCIDLLQAGQISYMWVPDAVWQAAVLPLLSPFLRASSTLLLVSALDPASLDYYGMLMAYWGMDQEQTAQIMVYDPDVTQDLLFYKIPTFLDPLVAQDPGLDWNDILSPIRDHSVRYGPYIMGLPIDARLILTYYREDIFKAAGLPPPETWEDVLMLAMVLNGTDFDGDGQGDYTLCMDMSLGCIATTWPDTFLAQMAQHLGTSQGFQMEVGRNLTAPPYDLDMMEVLYSAPPGLAAYDLMLRLKNFVSPWQMNFNTTSLYCYHDNSLYVAGKCALAFSDPRLFKDLSKSAAVNDAIVKSTRITVLPGSRLVYDRKSRQMVPCNQTFCPYGQQGRNGSWINYAPIDPFPGYALTLSSKVELRDLPIFYSIISTLSSPQASKELVLSMDLPSGPFRKSQLDLRLWLDRGYPPLLAADYLKATTVSLLDNPNVAFDSRLLFNWMAGPLMAKLSGYLFLSGAPYLVPELAGALIYGWSQPRGQILEFGNSLDDVLTVELMSRQAPIPPRPTIPVATVVVVVEGKQAGVTMMALIRLTVCLCMLFLIVAAFAGVIFVGFTTGDQDGTKTGRMQLVGKKITLVQIYVHGCSNLASELTGDIVEQVHKLQRWCIQGLIHHNHGYEWTNTTDCAMSAVFEDVQDAMQFGVQVHVLLMKIPWPEDFLHIAAGRSIAFRQQGRDPTQVKIGDNNEDMQDDLETSLSGAGQSSSNSPSLRRVRNLSLESSPGTHITPASPKAHINPTSPGAHRRTMLFERVFGLSSRLSLDRLDTGSTEDVMLGLGSLSPCSVAFPDAMGHTGYMFADACHDAWMPVSVNEPNGTLAFRGAKVSLCIHSELMTKDNLTTNAKDKTVTVKGPACDILTHMSTLTQPGMTLISHSTYEMLPMELLWKTMVLIHYGAFELSEGSPASNLYLVLDPTLTCRMKTFHPVNSPQMCMYGTSSAPAGSATIVFAYAVGISALRSWDIDVANTAIKMMHAEAARLLFEFNGYQVEAANNLMLTAFASSHAAVLWCMALQRSLLHLDWPEELLQHELGECIYLNDEAATKEDVPGKLAFRGLRMKMGLDQGAVLGNLQPITGRVSYRGRVMNRAARIAAHAVAGQVLSTRDIWLEVMDYGTAHIHSLSHKSLGRVQLKGVSENLELVEVMQHTSIEEGASPSVYSSVDGESAFHAYAGTSVDGGNSIKELDITSLPSLDLVQSFLDDPTI